MEKIIIQQRIQNKTKQKKNERWALWNTDFCSYKILRCGWGSKFLIWALIFFVGNGGYLALVFSFFLFLNKIFRVPLTARLILTILQRVLCMARPSRVVCCVVLVQIGVNMIFFLFFDNFLFFILCYYFFMLCCYYNW
jgi:hypothetical protein